MERQDDRHDLALRYVQGLLNHQEKLQVYQWILEDSQFKLLLKQEMLLHKRLQSVQFQMDSDEKTRWLQNIKQRGIVEDHNNYSSFDWSNWVLKWTMPIMAYSVMNQIQRRWL